MSTLLHNILRAAASAMEIPVVICLLLLAFSAFSLGWWLAELLGERRHMNASLPRAAGDHAKRLRRRRASPAARIWKSGVRCTMMPRPAPITSSPMRRGTDPWRS